jgi:hypothetical protein
MMAKWGSMREVARLVLSAAIVLASQPGCSFDTKVLPLAEQALGPDATGERGRGDVHDASRGSRDMLRPGEAGGPGPEFKVLWNEVYSYVSTPGTAVASCRDPDNMKVVAGGGACGAAGIASSVRGTDANGRPGWKITCADANEPAVAYVGCAPLDVEPSLKSGSGTCDPGKVLVGGECDCAKPGPISSDGLYGTVLGLQMEWTCGCGTGSPNGWGARCASLGGTVAPQGLGGEYTASCKGLHVVSGGCVSQGSGVKITASVPLLGGTSGTEATGWSCTFSATADACSAANCHAVVLCHDPSAL